MGAPLRSGRCVLQPWRNMLDDMDHFGNRRLRSVGELFQNQIRIGLNRLTRIANEQMSGDKLKTFTIAKLVNG